MGELSVVILVEQPSRWSDVCRESLTRFAPELEGARNMPRHADIGCGAGVFGATLKRRGAVEVHPLCSGSVSDLAPLIEAGRSLSLDCSTLHEEARVIQYLYVAEKRG